MEKVGSSNVLEALRPHIEAQAKVDERPLVVMMCGIAGSGKSTLARGIVEAFPNFTRVSIDGILAARHGIYNIDYPPSKYEEYQEEADGIYEQTLLELLRESKSVVLDRSFYAKADRDEYKALVAQEGGRSMLVYLQAEPSLLWKRICERRARSVNADSALEIDEELLAQYVASFEVPVGEGEIVICVV